VRRSHRLALSALVALAGLVAAGRLATTALEFGERGRSSFGERGRSSRGLAHLEDRPLSPTSARVYAEDGGADGAERAVAATFDVATARAKEEARRFGSAAAIALDDPQIALGAALAISGRDAGAPRAIELWRVAGARAARVAVGTSRPDGGLDFPLFVLPAGAVTLVAAPRGEGAGSPNASAPVVASRDPAAPRLVAFDADAESVARLTIEPSEPGGSIVLAHASQQEIGRTPVVAGADATPARLEIAVELAPEDSDLLVAQEAPDGRRSPWRRVVLTNQPQGE
jgi:hypothetical protein